MQHLRRGGARSAEMSGALASHRPADARAAPAELQPQTRFPWQRLRRIPQVPFCHSLPYGTMESCELCLGALVRTGCYRIGNDDDSSSKKRRLQSPIPAATQPSGKRQESTGSGVGAAFSNVWDVIASSRERRRQSASVLPPTAAASAQQPPPTAEELEWLALQVRVDPQRLHTHSLRHIHELVL